MTDAGPQDKIVLVVDDSAPIRLLVRKVLDDMGVKEVRMAENGVDALKAIAKPAPNLIITDHQMEPMDGLHLVRLIRGQGSTYGQRVPIIMLSGHSDSDVIQEAMKAGADDFLTKPISPKLLHDRVDRIFKANPDIFAPVGDFEVKKSDTAAG